MPRLENLVDHKFGRLRVTKYSHKTEYSHHMWHCICECDGKKIVWGGNLKFGGVRSCGCIVLEQLKTHGLSHIPEHAVWVMMRQRCNNLNNINVATVLYL